MARRPRAETEAGIWHVYARGNNRETIFRGLADLTEYLTLLDHVSEWCRWRCLSYCLMPNHVHLLIETTEPNLGIGMRELHGRYARAFNKAHGRCGHVFQGRYGSKRIKDDTHLWTEARYVALNPVKARLCRAPEDWRWSSHRAVVNGEPPAFLDVERLFELFGIAGGDPQDRYEQFVLEGITSQGQAGARALPEPSASGSAEDLRSQRRRTALANAP